MIRRAEKRLCFTGCVLLAIVPCVPVWAAGAADRQASASEEPSELKEVIVTAQKVKEDLQSVPIAITALTSKLLEQRNITSLVDIGKYVPGLIFSQGAGANGGSIAALIFIRGIGQRNAQPFADPAVGLYVDGVYFGHVVGAVLNTVDAQSIEVLRGPQGTLYGANTLAGAIVVNSKMPTGDTGGYFDVGYGNYNERNEKGALEFPITAHTLSARVDFSSLQHDGYDPDPILGRALGSLNQQAGRGVVRWTPSDNFVGTFTADVTTEHDTPQALHPTAIDPTATNGIGEYNLFVSGALSGAPGDYDSRYVLPGRESLATGSYLNSFSNDLHSWGSAANLKWDIGAVTVTSITGYREMDTHVGSDTDGSPIAYSGNEVYDKETQRSEELHLNGNAYERLKWLTGVYYSNEGISDITLASQAPLAPLPIGFQARQQIDAKDSTWAAFTQETLDLGHHVSLTAGVRYNRDTKDFVAQSLLDGRVNFPPSPLGGRWNSTTPKVSLEYNPSENWMGYVTYSEGYKSGGVNYQLLSRNDYTLYNPERTSNWETGTKLQFLHRRVRLNTALYDTLYKDMQFEHTFYNAAVCGGETNFCARTLNAAAARIYGVESELTALPGGGLQLFANAAYMHARVTEVDPAVIALLAVDPTVINLHTILPETPRWTATAGASYVVAFGDIGELTLRGDYSYQSLVYFDTSDEPGASQGGFSLVNVGAFFDTTDGHWRLALSIENAMNKLYASNGTGTTLPSSGFSFVSYGPPRQITGSVRYRLGEDE
jgi:iron complex outermembrane recepter protein